MNVSINQTLNINQNLNQKPQSVLMANIQQNEVQNIQLVRQNMITNNQSNNNNFSRMYSSDDIDLSIYPAPHPISPLGKQLSKLLPYN